MNYSVENRWGGEDKPFHPGGLWVLGDRCGQGIIEIDITSKNDGKSFEGHVTYAGEGQIGFKAQHIIGFSYQVEYSWGGTDGHKGGSWVIGQRVGQPCIALNVKSTDGGKILSGTCTYKGEGPIAFLGKAGLQDSNRTIARWGGVNEPWHDGGVMVVSSRSTQAVESLDIKSSDKGKTFTGSMVYQHEGPIAVKCTYIMGNTYSVENRWGGDKAPWHNAGLWLIGGRDEQRAELLNVSASPLTGKTQYIGEGEISIVLEPQC